MNLKSINDTLMGNIFSGVKALCETSKENLQMNDFEYNTLCSYRDTIESSCDTIKSSWACYRGAHNEEYDLVSFGKLLSTTLDVLRKIEPSLIDIRKPLDVNTRACKLCSLVLSSINIVEHMLKDLRQMFRLQKHRDIRIVKNFLFLNSVSEILKSERDLKDIPEPVLLCLCLLYYLCNPSVDETITVMFDNISENGYDKQIIIDTVDIILLNNASTQYGDFLMFYLDKVLAMIK